MKWGIQWDEIKWRIIAMKWNRLQRRCWFLTAERRESSISATGDVLMYYWVSVLNSFWLTSTEPQHITVIENKRSKRCIDVLSCGAVSDWRALRPIYLERRTATMYWCIELQCEAVNFFLQNIGGRWCKGGRIVPERCVGGFASCHAEKQFLILCRKRNAVSLV